MEYDGELLERLGTDGQLWAKEFMKKTFEKIDEDLMISWFCNAIMAGYDKTVLEHNSIPKYVITVGDENHKATESDMKAVSELTRNAGLDNPLIFPHYVKIENIDNNIELVRFWRDMNYCSCFNDNYILGMYNAAEGILGTIENRKPVYESIAPYAERLIYEIKFENILPEEATNNGI